MTKVYAKQGQGSLDADLDKDSNVIGLWEMGFIEPEKITGYNCPRCAYVEGSPDGAVDVTMLGGQVVGSARYSCTACGRTVLREFIPRERLREVPVDYIGEDSEFMFTQPDAGDMMRSVDDAVKAAGKGQPHHEMLRRAERISDKIGVPLPTYVQNEIQEAREEYLHANMAEILGQIPVPETYADIPAEAYELIRIATERGIPDDAEEKLQMLTSTCCSLFSSEQMRLREAAMLLQQRWSTIGAFLDPPESQDS